LNKARTPIVLNRVYTIHMDQIT